jgi:amino acid permease
MPSHDVPLILLLPQSAFQIVCFQVNVFAVYSELQNKEARRMRKVMWRALYLEFVLYGCVAIFGYGPVIRTSLTCASTLKFVVLFSYLTFHEGTKGNILDSYDSSDSLFLIARICVFLSLSVAVPINIHPCRTNLEVLLLVAFVSFS